MRGPGQSTRPGGQQGNASPSVAGRAGEWKKQTGREGPCLPVCWRRERFPERFRATQGDLYGVVDSLVSPSARVPVPATRDALTGLTETIPGAPNVSQMFVNNRIGGIKNAFDIDTGAVIPNVQRSTTIAVPGTAPTPYTPRTTVVEVPGTPSGRRTVVPGEGTTSRAARVQPHTVSRTVNTSMSRAGEGRPPNQQDGQAHMVSREINPRAVVPGEGARKTPDPTMPYEAVAKLRSTVGRELSDVGIASDVPRSQWKQLYGGLSQDMQGAVTAAGPEAAQAFNRANTYTRAGMDRIDRIEPFANKTAPEQAYTALMSSTREGVSTLRTIKRSVTPETRAKIAATALDRMGRATPGNQNDLGDVWSPETFLTNWNRITPAARKELFSGFKGSDEMLRQAEATAKAASYMRDASKLWANPSGTGGNAAARSMLFGGAGLLGGAGLGFAIDPLAAIGIPVGTLLGASGASRLLTSAGAVRYFAEGGTVARSRGVGVSQLGLLGTGYAHVQGDAAPPTPAEQLQGLLGY